MLHYQHSYSIQQHLKRITATHKILATTVFVGIVAFFSGPIIWPTAEDIDLPVTLVPLALLMGAYAIDCLFFGLGVALLVFGWPLFSTTSLRRGNATLAFAALVWIVISWWPHTNFHRAVGDNSVFGLIAIEYGFHSTVVLAGAYIIYSLTTNSTHAERQHRG